MAELDYRIPGSASEIYRWCVDELRRSKGQRELKVLDLCAGYGVNGALMKLDLSLDELYGYFARQLDIGVASAFFDRLHLAARTTDPDLQVIGLDVAAKALDYARAAGFIDNSHAVNLETEPLPPPLRITIAQCSLISITGGFSFIGATTFAKVLSALAWSSTNRPWIVGFPLLHTQLGPLIELLESHGYVVHRDTQHRFLQRRFADKRERDGEHAALARANLGASGGDYFESRLLLAQPPGAPPVPGAILAHAADREADTQLAALRA